MRFTSLVVTMVVALQLSTLAFAEEEAPRQVLFKNVNVFDGVSHKLINNASVLVEGNLIKTVSQQAIKAEGAYVVDGGGRTLMPGLIDMHSHLCLENGMLVFRDGYDAMAAGAWTGYAMGDYLDQGFTTVRDAGCNILAIAKAVNNGIIAGPRIYPSGAFLTQTGGAW